jgi:hypothetical protein
MIPNTFFFVATYADGSQITQNVEDRSAYDVNKNCFFDVLSREEGPVSFVITDGTQVFGVDLRDGHFEVNGVPFFQHRPEHVPLKDFRLKYCRTPEQTINTMTGETGGRIAGYSLGWEAEHKGETVERVLSIYLD